MAKPSPPDEQPASSTRRRSTSTRRAAASTATAPLAKGEKRRATAILGSARRVDLRSRGAREQLRRRKAADWQAQAWEHYDRIGEVHYPVDFVGNVSSRLRLYVGVRDDPETNPRPVRLPPRPGDDPLPDGVQPDDGGEQAVVELERLAAAEGGYGPLLRDLARNLVVPGECYVCMLDATEYELDDQGKPKRDPMGNRIPLDGGDPVDEWAVLSIDELTVNAENTVIRKAGPDDTTGEELPEDTVASRVWRRHPRWSLQADSAMRAVSDTCRELLTLSAMARSVARSRLALVGLGLIPDELTFVDDDEETDDEAEDGASPAARFLEKFLATLEEAIDDPESAAAWAPMLLRGPKDLLEAVKFVKLERGLNPEDVERAEHLIRRLAQGLDLPVEVVVGVSDVNHWSAWQVSEDTFQSHIAPLAELMVGALSRTVLWPALAVAGVEDYRRFVIWYDAAPVLAKPDRSKSADEAFDRWAISYAAYRAAKGFDEGDEPTDEEIARRLAIEAAKAPRFGAPAAPADEAPQGPPADDDAGDEEAPEAAAVMAALADFRADVAQQLARIRRSDAERFATRRRRGDLGQLGARLVEIDRKARDRMVTAADAALTRALERAGAQARTLAQRRRAADLRDAMAGLENVAAVAAIGERGVERLGTSAFELVDDQAFAQLRAKWDATVRRAQDEALNAARYAADDETLGGPNIDERQATDRDAGWALLSGALLALARDRLYDPQAGTSSAAGEFDTTMAVPVGLVRSALARAGGAEAELVEGGTQPAGGVATGSLVRYALAEADVATVGYVWRYGAASDRSRQFEAHLELDGFEFASWDDPTLATRDEDSWIGASFYFPGDHPGCSCDFEQAFTRGTAAADLEATA